MSTEKNQRNNLEPKWTLVNFCEFDKYATQSYCAIHDVDESLNLGDITLVDETKLEPFTMICGGSPCQDFSVAGQQNGSVWTCKECGHEYNPLTVHWSKRIECPRCQSKKIEKTRSSLLVEYLRIVRTNKPNFGIYENVKNIVGKKFLNTTFKLFETELQEYGYNTYWKVLNSKDYGVPQNRERLYLIFIKTELDNGKFRFPNGFDNGIRLKDVLEHEVDEKYYINNERAKQFLENLKKEENSSMFNSEPRRLGGLYDSENSKHQAGSVWDSNLISPTIDTMQGGNRQPCIVEEKEIITGIVSQQEPCWEKATNIANTLLARDYKGFGNQGMNCVVEIKNNDVLENTHSIMRVGQASSEGSQSGTVYSTNGVSPTLIAGTHGYAMGNILEDESFKLRVRKLTALECWKLMGFSVGDFLAAKVGSKQVAKEILNKYPNHYGKSMMAEIETVSKMSNTQLYKQAGNSIVVDVLYYIFVELHKAMPYLFEDLKLSSFFSGIGAFEKALDRLYETIQDENFTRPQVE